MQEVNLRVIQPVPRLPGLSKKIAPRVYDKHIVKYINHMNFKILLKYKENDLIWKRKRERENGLQSIEFYKLGLPFIWRIPHSRGSVLRIISAQTYSTKKTQISWYHDCKESLILMRHVSKNLHIFTSIWYEFYKHPTGMSCQWGPQLHRWANRLRAFSNPPRSPEPRLGLAPRSSGNHTHHSFSRQNTYCLLNLL